MIATPPLPTPRQVSILSWDAEGLQYLPLCSLFPGEPPTEAPHQGKAYIRKQLFFDQKTAKCSMFHRLKRRKSLLHSRAGAIAPVPSLLRSRHVSNSSAFPAAFQG